MSNNDRSSNQRFLPHAIQAFFWGQNTQHPNDLTGNQQGRLHSHILGLPLINPNLFVTDTGPAALNPTETVPPPTLVPTHVPPNDNSDSRSDSSMPDLLSDGWSDSDSSQDARDVEMEIVPDDADDNWVDEDEEMPPFYPTVPVDRAPATDRRARVEEEAEPQSSRPSHTSNPTPSHTGAGVAQPLPTLPPWNFGLGTTRPPGRLFPLFPNPAGPSGIGNNATSNRGDTITNPPPQPTRPPQPDRNSAPGNAQQDTQGPRFHAHTFVLGVDAAGRPVPIPPAAFSAMFNPSGPAAPQPQARTTQPGQPPDQPGENGNQPRQPGDPVQPPPFFDFVVGGIGPLPPFFADTFGPGQQGPADDPGNGGGPEFGGGAPIWAELLRTMLGGEPPEEKEDPERAKKLVGGLEHVPEGLVRRMTRVDDIPGAHEDLAETDGGKVPGCAICWDNLLPEDPLEGTKIPSDSTSPLTSERPTTTKGFDPSPDDGTPAAIICLPCSHVFHASCLVPWFSKPKHTTCPTCRFDIDPKNLTYTPPRRQHPAPPTATNTANDTQPQPVPNSTSTTTNTPAVPPPTTRRARDHEHPPPLEPLSDDEDDDEHDDDPDFLVEPPDLIPVPEFFTAQPQRTFFDMFRGLATSQAQDHNNGEQEQDHDQLPGETQGEAPNNVPPIFGFGFGHQQPPVFGPPPPPEHPTHGTGAAAADATHDHGPGPHPGPFPDFGRGGVGHAHFHAPGIAVDFTLHVPSEQGLDPERISQAVRDQAATFLRFFAEGGRGPEMGQPTGPAPAPGAGVNHEPEAPREWMPPSAPGPTLRQRVEAKERLAGLRCYDPSCGIGPSDEDPFPEVFDDPDSPSIKRVWILKDGGEEAVCAHLFHPSCLVSADRCAGWGEGDRATEDGGEEHKVVSCPVCRGVGKVQKEVWEEGAKALLA